MRHSSPRAPAITKGKPVWRAFSANGGDSRTIYGTLIIATISYNTLTSFPSSKKKTKPLKLVLFSALLRVLSSASRLTWVAPDL